jgi:hypothetical protein
MLRASAKGLAVVLIEAALAALGVHPLVLLVIGCALLMAVYWPQIRPALAEHRRKRPVPFVLLVGAVGFLVFVIAAWAWRPKAVLAIPIKAEALVPELEAGKSQSSQDLLRLLDFSTPEREATTRARIRHINDYVFLAYLDISLKQDEWFKKNKRYFQGLKTMPEIPSYEADVSVDPPFGPSDQLSHWREFGYQDERAPVQLSCDQYSGPSGHGFTVMAQVRIGDFVASNQFHHGPEDYRNQQNFKWIIKRRTTQPNPMQWETYTGRIRIGP